jgi:hypothetical protein
VFRATCIITSYLGANADTAGGRGDAAVFDCRGLDQKGKLLELRFPPANRRAFDATQDALRRIGLRLAFYPYPDPLDNMICWPVSVRVDNV